jgi:hypothetical protein
MSNPQLQTLFNKPISSKLREFEVIINIPVTGEDGKVSDVNVEIEDKTKDKLVNRARFMKSIKSKRKVIDTLAITQRVEKDDLEPEKKEKIKKDAINKLIIKPSQKKKLKQDLTDTTIAAISEIKTIQIGDEILSNRLPIDKESKPIIKSNYFMNNREKFIKFVNDLLKPYRQEILDENKETCENKSTKKDQALFTHQKIVRDYINLYTPYRGALLYHGLGSGKTCSSIAIAENINKNVSIITAESMITNQKIVVLTPASLRTNYIEEIKNCGNPIYKKKQFWEFINTDENPELIEVLSASLNLPVSYINTQHGAWLVNVTKPTNYDKLSETEQSSLNLQLKAMIDQKFIFHNYNGSLSRKSRLKELTASGTINMFDNKVVIIDEAHNLVSRIVNKIEKSKPTPTGDYNTEDEPSLKIYDMLLSANNCKIVLLTGTPIINYPNELGIMFNLLRGYIKTWHIPVNETRELKQRITIELLQKILKREKHLDFVSYNSNVLTITRNPFGFVNTVYREEYKGVKLNTNGDIMEDTVFIDNIIKTLTKNNIECVKSNIKIVLTKALPDKLDEFNNKFIDSDKGDVKNIDIFKRRIVGLTSYLNDKENLMPQYDADRDFYPERIEMSDYQFAKYQDVRNAEITKDQNKKKNNNLFTDSASSYRIFSRSYCNFVFPEDYPRPFPNDGGIAENIENMKNEDDIDGLTDKDKVENPNAGISEDDVEKPSVIQVTYKQKLKDAIDFLSLNADRLLSIEGLEMYSPKFLKILKNILNKENLGLHLLYSQFRTVEGIGIFSLVLKANGFIQFKLIKNSSGQYILDIPEGIIVGQRMFALYTGTESAEEKELTRNIYNGDWNLLPNNLALQLKQVAPNNNMGEIIKLMIISASGAEGISLKNTRFVHIMEPYWHPVRTEQVIGRARRICSHENLEEPLRNIKVILYLMKISEQQAKTASNQLQRFDISKTDKDNKIPLTTDENLFELARRKQNIHKQLLKCVKETAIDCAIQFKSTSGEELKCYSFAGETDPNVYSYKPNIANEETDRAVQKVNKKEVIFKARVYTADGKKYAMKMDEQGKPTGILYDIDIYKKAKEDPDIEMLPVGRIIQNPDGTTKVDFN